MRYVVLVGLALLLTNSAGAETYSWVDDKGTYNFTEDFSSVPKKYRKKVKHTADIDPVKAPATSTVNQGKAGATKNPELSGAKSAGEKTDGTTQGSKQLYGGKTHDAWRAELSQGEAELAGIKLQIDAIKSALNKPAVEERVRLYREYNELVTTYNQKHASYSELIETARKAGLVIEYKK